VVRKEVARLLKVKASEHSSD